MTRIATKPPSLTRPAPDTAGRGWEGFAQVVFDAISSDPQGVAGVAKRWGVRESTLRGWMPRDCEKKSCPPFDRLAQEIGARMNCAEFVALARSLVIAREVKHPGTIARLVEALQPAAREDFAPAH